MKTIKIIILILAVTLAIGGVLFFAKDSVDPPVATKDVDQYTTNLLEGYQKMEHTPNKENKEKIFDNLLNKIDIYVAEDKLSPKKGNKQIKELATRYSQWFLKLSFNKFMEGTWADNDVSYMLATITKMKELKDFSNSSALRRSTMDSLVQAEGIINNYKHAWSIARGASYSSVSQARATINSALELVNDEYLSRCSDLVSALNGVQSKLASSHYNYVCKRVEGLSNYRSYSQDYFEYTLVPEVDQIIRDYENNAADLYGSVQNVESLWNKSSTYYSEAMNYYDTEDSYYYDPDYDDSYYYYNSY